MPKKYNSLKVRAELSSRGNVRLRVPFIAFLGDKQVVTNGFYPVFLYYKENETLVLSYGLSAKTSGASWDFPKLGITTPDTIEKYFGSTKHDNRYDSSFVYKVYSLAGVVSHFKSIDVTDDKTYLKEAVSAYGFEKKFPIDADLEFICDQYMTLFGGIGTTSAGAASASTSTSVTPPVASPALTPTALPASTPPSPVSTSYDYPYRKYLSAIKSKPFLLLAGLSGTGKSRLARELARACWDKGTPEYEAHKPKNFELIQVKPNWHDSSELIGYYSRIAKTNPYIIGPFLRFMAKAIQDPDTPYILCLDEMNLAPVEQYFAEYLSVIETRKVKDGKVVTDPIIDRKSDGYEDLIKVLFPDEATYNEYLYPSDEKLRKYLSIPQNLIVIGTVNMDESTYSFSRKVLDRAMSIEMNEVDLHSGLDSRYEPIGESGKIGYSDLIGNAVEGVDVYSSYKAICDKAIDYLKSINDTLEGTPFKVAYRTRNEFLLYVVNNLPYCIDESGGVVDENKILARALDEITSMKVLSRIEGDETKVDKKLLESLSTVIGDQLKAISAQDYADEASASAELSISMAKLKEMILRLDSGFTSFWS